jgi:branched chain amino acid efflux pump
VATALFRRGFVAMLPLWLGAVPVGIAYGVAAQAAGLSAGVTQIMSLIVFSAAAQVSAVSLIDGGAPAPVLVVTAMALNAQLLLLGLAVGRQIRLTWRQRLVTAWFLTDGAYGITAASGRLTWPALMGAGVSMYVGWNVGTALGIVAGQAAPDLQRLGIDFVVPLAFLAVLVPLLRTRATAETALVAGGGALVLGRLVPVGVAVLAAGALGCAAGTWQARHSHASTAGGIAAIGDGGT